MINERCISISWHWPNLALKGKCVTQRTLVKSVARKWYPWLAIGRSCHAADNGQVWQKQWCPLLEDFVSLRTLTKCDPKCAPHWRTFSRSGLQPNVAQNVPLIGGLCHAADLSRTQKSYNWNLLYQEMSTRSGSNLALRIPINFYCYTCNNVY